MNFFAHQTAAERYARGRPDFHPLIAERIRAVCAVDDALPRVLDVGCGTGFSTVALAPLAREVAGVDVSPDMLANAKQHPRVRYVEAPAEALPFADGHFDLATVGVAFHWFERPRFLDEAARVLRCAAWLVIYNDGFSGSMRENPSYERWNREA